MALTKAQKAEREALRKKQAKIAYNNEFNKANYLSYSFRLSRANEYKYITWLASQPEGLKPYIIKLIDADMKRQKRRKKVVNAEEVVETDTEGNIESESV